MSKCEFCGQEAGFLRKKHKECQEKHDAGVKEILEAVRNAITTANDFKPLDENVHKIAKTSFISDDALQPLLIQAWGSSVDQAMDDDLFTTQEEEALTSFREHFSLSQDELDKNGSFSKLVKAAVIREILEGKLPQRVKIVGTLPFNFQKSETLVWVFQNVEYYETRTRTHYVGGYTGVSLRVAKGVYYRVGGFRGDPVRTQATVHADTGILAVTNKHIYFGGSRKSFKISFDKIVSFDAHSDGVGVQRDALTAKPQSFVTGDGWFTYNLLMNLAQMRAS